jgi:hypothetical protein
MQMNDADLGLLERFFVTGTDSGKCGIMTHE